MHNIYKKNSAVVYSSCFGKNPAYHPNTTLSPPPHNTPSSLPHITLSPSHTHTSLSLSSPPHPLWTTLSPSPHTTPHTHTTLSLSPYTYSVSVGKKAHNYNYVWLEVVTCPWDTATWRGVFPALFWEWMSAPYLMNRSAWSRCPYLLTCTAQYTSWIKKATRVSTASCFWTMCNEVECGAPHVKSCDLSHWNSLLHFFHLMPFIFTITFPVYFIEAECERVTPISKLTVPPQYLHLRFFVPPASYKAQTYTCATSQTHSCSKVSSTRLPLLVVHIRSQFIHTWAP